MKQKCLYCPNDGDVVVTMEESGLRQNVCVCPECMQLLKNPNTAFALIRGSLTLRLRGKMPPDELKKRIDDFISMLYTWKH